MEFNLKHCNSTGPCGTVQRLFGSVDSKQNHIRTVEHISMQVRQEELQNWVRFFQEENSDLDILKSVNLEYNTLVRWDDGPNESLTKRIIL